jgi:GNAT superfamily N-acetyltransferase
MRRATPGDAPALASMLARLSPQSRYLRFGSERPLQGDEALREAERMLRSSALVATAGGAELVAVAELAADKAGGGELAVVVRDDHQARGVGGALVRRLLDQASGQCIATVRCYILPENRAMLRLVRRLEVPKQSRFHHGLIEYTLRTAG